MGDEQNKSEDAIDDAAAAAKRFLDPTNPSYNPTLGDFDPSKPDVVVRQHGTFDVTTETTDNED